jgi:phage terminase large subunit-like protein
VTYNPVPDTYTVERSFRRGLKEWIKGRADNVYYDQLPEQVYRAGCFNDDWPEGGARA